LNGTGDSLRRSEAVRVSLRRRMAIAAAIIAGLSLLGWGFLHPDFRPDPSTIDPSVRAALSRTGFASTRGVSAARFETVESAMGSQETWTTHQKVVAIDSLITEKRSRRRAPRVLEETSGLYVGPFAVVRFQRTWPPVVGDLLPYHFWTSSRLTRLIVEETDRFPHAKSGRMRARVTYEDHYSGGKLAQAQSFRLTCDVTDIVEAASINSSLSGPAARIACQEEAEPDGPRLSADNPGTYTLDRLAYSHWYVPSRGWSIAIEGERVVRLGDKTETLKWSSKLVSVD
jgi:hypothetical protein